MWKALIKLVESWGHRCEHKFVKVDETAVYETVNSKMPHTRKYIFMCAKCGEIKKFKS